MKKDDIICEECEIEFPRVELYVYYGLEYCMPCLWKKMKELHDE